MDAPPNPPAGGLPQAEIERIAARILARMSRSHGQPPPDDPRDDILAPRFELPPGDEDRVVAAVLARRRP
jgi:hypothetical protein